MIRNLIFVCFKFYRQYSPHSPKLTRCKILVVLFIYSCLVPPLPLLVLEVFPPSSLCFRLIGRGFREPEGNYLKVRNVFNLLCHRCCIDLLDRSHTINVMLPVEIPHIF